LDKIRKYGNDVEVCLVQINIVYEVRTWVKLVYKTVNKNDRGVTDFSTTIPCNERAAIYQLYFEASPLSLSPFSICSISQSASLCVFKQALV
jgi:hypothetical protein